MPAPAIRFPLARIRLGRLDDGRLAALSAAGDERAFEALYDRHHRPLLGFCRHLLGSREEGEDALQQTFVRAHRALLASGAPDEMRPWLFAIARNRCLTLLAARRTAAVPSEELEPATEGLASEVERRADLRALLGDIERLPADQRSALLLAELADLPHAEIASVIGVPATRVKALVHQARSRLLAEREARETPCALVREQLATGRGGELRRGPLRRHVAGCAPCRAYKAAIAQQRSALALVLPVLPSAGLKQAILGAIAGGGGGGTAAAVGAAAGGSTLMGGGSGGLAAKLAVGAALAGGAGGGGVVVKNLATGPERDVPPPAALSAPANAAAPPRGAPASTGASVVNEPAAERAPVRRRVAAGRRDSAKRPARSRSKGRGAPGSKARRITQDQRTAARSERAANRVAAKEQRAADRAAAMGQRTALRESRTQSLPASRAPRVRPLVKPAPPRKLKPSPAPPAAAPGAPGAPGAPKREAAKDRGAAEPLP